MLRILQFECDFDSDRVQTSIFSRAYCGSIGMINVDAIVVDIRTSIVKAVRLLFDS